MEFEELKKGTIYTDSRDYRLLRFECMRNDELAEFTEIEIHNQGFVGIETEVDTVYLTKRETKNLFE